MLSLLPKGTRPPPPVDLTEVGVKRGHLPWMKMRADLLHEPEFAELNLAERGLFVSMLMAGYNRDTLPSDPGRLDFFVRCGTKEIDSVLPGLLARGLFKQSECKNFFVSEPLEELANCSLQEYGNRVKVGRESAAKKKRPKTALPQAITNAGGVEPELVN